MKAEEANPTYQDYLSSDFIPVLCKGYHPEKNPGKDYDIAKEPAFNGWTKADYLPPSLENTAAWEKAGGWTGWRPPKGVIVLDVDNGSDDEARVREICRARNIEPGVHRTNKGLHFFFRNNKQLPGSSEVFLKCGLQGTYRVSNSQVILAPINGRTWEVWK
jgi:hypothetical protein